MGVVVYYRKHYKNFTFAEGLDFHLPSPIF